MSELRKLLFVAVLATFSLCGDRQARADWLRFRGPNGSGICADDAEMPESWHSSANLKWKTELPGAGVSSPIVVGDRVYVTCYSGYGVDRESPGDMKDLKRHLVSIDRSTGTIVWTRTVDPVLPEDPFSGMGVPDHGYATNTPVSDGENIYVFFGKTGALAFNADGKRLWQTSVGTESDPKRWGTAASPIIHENLLIVPAMAESEALVALDTRTGKERWRREASGFSNSWSTPALARVDETRTDLVMTVCKEIWGFNPKTGKLRWYGEGAKARSFSSSPISKGGIVYAIEGQIGAAMAVRAGGAGDVTKTHVLWIGRDSGRFASPILHEGHLYSFAADKISVIDAATGERINRVRLEGGTEGHGRDYASPILADGKFYYVRRSGDVYVLRADPSLTVISLNRVTDDQKEEFCATPAADDGALWLRSNKHLYCIADLGQQVPEGRLAARSTTAEEPAPDKEARGRRRGRSGRNGRGRRFDPKAMLARRDANKDGKLTADEIPEPMRGRMKQLDSDADGALTPEELKRGVSGGSRGRRGGQRDERPRPDKPERPERPELES